MFENVRRDLVTKLFLGTLTFLSAKTSGVITLAGTSTLFTPDGVFFLKEKALGGKRRDCHNIFDR